jgi:hypothetical protein
MLVHEVPEKVCQVWRRLRIRKVAELSNGQDAEHLQGLNEPEGENSSGTVVESP